MLLNTDHNKITNEGLPNQDITLTADFNQEQENGLLILNKHDGKVPGNVTMIIIREVPEVKYRGYQNCM